MIFIIIFETNSGIRSVMHSTHLNGYNIILKNIRESNGEKIIFVGGSNLGFGLNSKRIQDSLDIKTFNFGVHGGLGIKKPIEDISPYLNPTDIVIFSPEYANFELMKHEGDRYVVDFYNGFGTSSIYDIETFRHYIMHIKTILRDIMYGQKGYNINYYNENGDIVGHYKLQNKPVLFENDKNNITVDKLEELKSFIESKLNRTAYYIIPPVTHNHRFTIDKEIALNEDLLRVFKKKYPLSISSMTFGKENFYDSEYHLNYEGQKLRTNIMLEFLKTIKKETQN